ncbi:MAG: hypothetical protein ACKV0T_15430 [Planctomycetales bacterium]
MRQQRHESAESVITLRLWSQSGAVNLAPYVRSLMQSIRNEWLQLRQAQERKRRMEARTGVANRDALIQLSDVEREISRNQGNLEETVEELVGLSVYCLDPATGLAVIPSLSEGDLAWFIFDLFDPAGIVAWRKHTDPLETRRPLSEFIGTEPDSGSAPPVTELPGPAADPLDGTGA